MPRYDEAFADRFLAPWNRQDVDGALALMIVDCVWEVARGSEPHGTLFEGPSAVRLAIAGAFEVLPDIHYQPLRSLFGEEHVVLGLLATGTPCDGAKTRFYACDILIMRDGQIVAKRSYRKVVE